MTLAQEKFQMMPPLFSGTCQVSESLKTQHGKKYVQALESLQAAIEDPTLVPANVSVEIDSFGKLRTETRKEPIEQTCAGGAGAGDTMTVLRDVTRIYAVPADRATITFKPEAGAEKTIVIHRKKVTGLSKVFGGERRSQKLFVSTILDHARAIKDGKYPQNRLSFEI